MRKQIFFFSVGLILLALCSCDKSMQNETETNATMAKAKKRATARWQPSELGSWFVNPALDDEYQLSEEEIVSELSSYGFLDNEETMDITPIYFEDVIPTFFKSLIVEPESNEWYGINVDEVMNMYIEWPSIAFYIVNTSSEKAFLTTADRRYACNLIHYRTPSVLYPEVVSAYEEVVDMLYTQGLGVSYNKFDSLTFDLIHDAFGVPRQDDLFNLKMYMSMFHMQKWVDLGGGVTYCDNIRLIHQEDPLLTEDYRWGQCEIFGGCDHNLASGSIALSILKILCLHNYSCRLEGEDFDGAAYRDNRDMINYFAWRLYDIIESAGQSRSQQGLRILTDCGFRIPMRDGYDMQKVRLSINDGKPAIIEKTNGHWELIDGYQAFETTCDNFAYLYSVDKNECKTFHAVWGSPYPLYNVYCYELY